MVPGPDHSLVEKPKGLHFIVYQTLSPSVKVCTEEVQWSIVDSQGKKVFKTFTGSSGWKNHNWKSNPAGGYSCVLAPGELLDKFDEFCPDGNLHIRFKFLVSLRPPFDLWEASEESDNNKEGDDPSRNKRFKRSDDLFDMMIELTPDVTLNLKDGSELKVNSHKLMESSTEFTGLMTPEKLAMTNGIVEIIDVNRDVMFELLRYVFCGKVRDIRKNGIEIFKAACKYKVVGLVEDCAKAISRHVLGIENVLEIVQLAIQYSEDLFESCCIAIKL